MSAWLGLVPRQSSSGDKQILLGISKRGDRYLRTLLIHGARAVLSHYHCCPVKTLIKRNKFYNNNKLQRI